MDKTVMLVWSKAAILGVCGLMLGMKQAPSRSGPRADGGGIEPSAGRIEADDLSPAYSETNCSCTGFSCGGVEYPPCSAVCSGLKHAFCSQGACSGPYGFESATSNACRCE
jgi:hypothetical protein